jgi:hypothetical protein
MTTTCLACSFGVAGLLLSSPLMALETVDFNREIRPIISRYCAACHGADEKKREAGLRLDIRESATAVRDGRRAIAPGDLKKSELFRRVSSEDPDERMPPPSTGKRLTAQEIDKLSAWIRQGAPYAPHWAYIKPVRPKSPAVSDRAWPKNEIDRFLLARLEKEKLRPSPEADRTTVVRRLTLDLTGLPPTPAEVEEFVSDKRPEAYEKLVDRLLARTSFGEHWARMWLDLARYADSAGYVSDVPREIWAYRDYVIRSLNADKPFDQFTIEQIAGDLLPNPTEDQIVATAFHRNTQTNNEGGSDREEYRNVAIVDRVNTTMSVWMGTTMACAQCHDHKYDPISQKEYFRFFAIFNNTEDADRQDESPVHSFYTPNQKEEREKLKKQIDELEPMVSAEEKATIDKMAAAQNAKSKKKKSKQPPAKQTAGTASPKNAGGTPSQREADGTRSVPATLPPAKPPATEGKQPSTAVVKPSTSIAKPTAKPLSDAGKRLADLKKRMAAIKPFTVPIQRELPSGKRRTTTIQYRGNFLDRGPVVTEGVPAAFPPLPKGLPPNRLALARWLVDENNPLTARVLVNRLWERIFGIGLVATSEDFGTQGELPSDPELLDYLAAELVASHWDIKHLIRRMVESAAYRQSSRITPDLEERDPENRLVARGPRFRLDAEAVRDQSLAVSGLLCRKMYGPAVRPFQPSFGLNAAFGGGMDWQTSEGEDRFRRAVYVSWRRTNPYPSMSTFDSASREVCCTRRPRTNTPLQALVTLNDPVYVEAAQALGRRMACEGGPSPADKVRYGFRLSLSRGPSDVETSRLVELYEKSRERFARKLDDAKKMAGAIPPGRGPSGTDVVQLAAWTAVGNVLLNLDEFLMRP